MTAGFYVENNHGTVLIDDTYANVCLLSKGNQSSPPPIVSEDFYAIQRDTNEWGSPYRWWRFGKPTSVASYGLVIYNAAGKPTFDATKKYARVVDVVEGPLGFTQVTAKTYASGRSYAVVTARGGFAEDLVTKPAGPGFPSNYVYYQYLIRTATSWVSGNTVRFGWTPRQPETGLWMGPALGGHRPERQTRATTYIVLDVTGY